MRFFQREKIFCVGRNKTGTTSLAKALSSFGYKVAPQKPAELLTDDWRRRSFSRLIRFCRRYDAFQDSPFSLDFTYVALDQAFPGSKFILSVRESAEEWFDSVVRFTSRIVGCAGPPRAEDLRRFAYCGDPARRGELLDRALAVYGLDESRIFDRDAYIRHYENHNRSVRHYFRHRPEDLLVLNLKQPDSMERLCEFLGLPHDGRSMPHENASSFQR